MTHDFNRVSERLVTFIMEDKEIEQDRHEYIQARFTELDLGPYPQFLEENRENTTEYVLYYQTYAEYNTKLLVKVANDQVAG